MNISLRTYVPEWFTKEEMCNDVHGQELDHFGNISSFCVP